MDVSEIAWLLGRIAGLAEMVLMSKTDEERATFIGLIVRECRALEREADRADH